MILHGDRRSDTSCRTRIALNLRGVFHEQAPVNLLIGDRRGEAYRALNPQALVPALDVDGALMTLSPALLQWLEEGYPTPPLPLVAATERARALPAVAAAHPDRQPDAPA